jgi:hypothetical protein
MFISEYFIGRIKSAIGCPKALIGARTLSLLHRTAVTGHDRNRLLPVWRSGERRIGGQLARGRGRDLAVEAQHFTGTLERVDHHAAQDLRYGVELQLERGNDPEVAAPAT